MKEGVSKAAANGKGKNIRAARPHFRTTILTVSKDTFRDVRRLKGGMIKVCEAVNDIVSSARGESMYNHHKIRRSALVRRQLNGGFDNIKVRTDGSAYISCKLVGISSDSDDDCTFKAMVKKA